MRRHEHERCVTALTRIFSLIVGPGWPNQLGLKIGDRRGLGEDASLDGQQRIVGLACLLLQ